MRHLVLNPGADAIVTCEPGAIGKHKHSHTVYSHERKKRYACVNDKHVFSSSAEDGYRSKPCGYSEEATYIVDGSMDNVYPLPEVCIHDV